MQVIFYSKQTYYGADLKIDQIENFSSIHKSKAINYLVIFDDYERLDVVFFLSCLATECSCYHPSLIYKNYINYSKGGSFALQNMYLFKCYIYINDSTLFKQNCVPLV